MNQFLLLRQQPLGILSYRLHAEPALRDMETAEFTRSARHGCQRLLGAEIAKIKLDLGVRPQQFGQFGNRKPVAGVNAQGRASGGNELANLVIEFRGETFELGGQASIDALLSPKQFFSKRRECCPAPAFQRNQGTAKEI